MMIMMILMIMMITMIIKIMMILTVGAKVGRSVVRYIDYSETLLWIIPTLLIMMMTISISFCYFVSDDEYDVFFLFFLTISVPF